MCCHRQRNLRLFYNKETFAAFKKDSLFINIGRGSAVDETALVEALKQDHLRGAALDVTSNEPLPSESVLYNEESIRDKLFLSCHSMDWGCKDENHVNEIFQDNLLAYLENKKLKTVVDKRAGY